MKKSDLYTNLRDLLVIDEDDLDSAVQEHAECYFKVAEAAALSASRKEEAKDYGKTLRAEVARELRGEAEGKVTEARIKEEVEAETSVQEADSSYHAASAEAARWSALLDTWKQRSYMLRAAVDLYLARVHTRDNVTGSNQHELEEVQYAKRKSGMAKRRNAQ